MDSRWPQQCDALGRRQRPALAIRRCGLRLHKHDGQWLPERHVALPAVSRLEVAIWNELKDRETQSQTPQRETAGDSKGSPAVSFSGESSVLAFQKGQKARAGRLQSKSSEMELSLLD